MKDKSKSYLSKGGLGPLDGDFAAVVNIRPDADGLSRDIAALVQPHPARHRPWGHAAQSQLVFYLAVERLL